MKTLNRVIGCIVLSIFVSCELPELKPKGDCLNAPVAKFGTNKNECDQPCDINIIDSTSASSNIQYSWSISTKTGTLLTSKNDKIPPDLRSLMGGEYTIGLKVKSQDNCETSFLKDIKVSNIVTFAKTYNFTTSDVDPLGLSELRSGKIHVLYREGTAIKSVQFDAKGNNIAGSDKLIPISISLTSSNITALKNGGFLLAGVSSTNGQIIMIDSLQNISSSINKTFQFSAGRKSEANAAITSSTSSDIFLTGMLFNSNNLGHAKISSIGTITSNSITHSKAVNYRGISLIENSFDLLVLGGFFNGSNTVGPARLFYLTTSGSYNTSADIAGLHYPIKIIALGGGKYGIIGKDNTGKCMFYDNNTTTPITLDLDDVKDIILHSSGHLLICGTRNKAIRIAKILPSNVTYADFPSTSTSDSFTGVSILESRFGNPIILGQSDGSKKGIYLIKTK